MFWKRVNEFEDITRNYPKWMAKGKKWKIRRGIKEH